MFTLRYALLLAVIEDDAVYDSLSVGCYYVAR